MNTTSQGPVFRAATGQLEGLQQREFILREQIAKYAAQRPILERQLRSPDAAIRAQGENQLLQLDLASASVKAELQSVQEQIALNGGKTAPAPRAAIVTPPPAPPPTFWSKIDPDAITAVMVLTTLALVVPLSVALTRRLWRRPSPPMPTTALDGLSMRLERVEQAVDAIAIEIERVSESQRFVAKVLVERPSPAPVVKVAESDQPQAIGEAQPFLALGAGPIEPIAVAQRQAVKQTITPH